MGVSIETVLDQYEPVTSEVIRAWSSGPVKRRLRPSESRDDWRQVSGTLWNPRVFGCADSWACPCGRFCGEEFAGNVCPVCGVKITSNVAREIRFGHINLSETIPHPFYPNATRLDAIPVVPTIFWASRSGQPLAETYEEIIRINLTDPNEDDLAGAYGGVIAFLRPLFEEVPEADEEQAERIARGMALRHRAPVVEDADDQDGNDDDWGELKLADE